MDGSFSAREPGHTLLQEFLPARLTSGNEGPAFRQASLAVLSELENRIASIRDTCTPREPLKMLAEFPTVGSIKRDTQLLNAQYRAFPYIGREDQIDKLVDWLEGPEPASFFVIAGGAGDGKTRLGFQLLERLQAKRPEVWRAGWLGSRRAEDALRNERFRKWRGTQPTLIIIDYAASFSEILRDNVVRELAEEASNSAPDLPPLRILLLEREADENRGWYNSLLREARDRAPDLFSHPVLRLPKLTNEQRRDLFSKVLEAAYNLNGGNASVLPVIEIPEAVRFSSDNFRQPIAVCMAALVAYRRGNLTSLGLNRLDLAREIANHEYGRLERVARTAGKPPFLLLHLGAYITSVGALSEEQLRNACREERAKVEADSPWSIPELQAVITTVALPAEDHRFAAEPIQPDIVGEAFIARVLCDDVAHMPAETFERAFAMQPRYTTRTLVRMVQDFSMPPGAPDSAARTAEAHKDWALRILTGLLSAKAQGIRDEDFWEVNKGLARNTTQMAEACRNFYRTVHEYRGEGDDIGVEALAQDCSFSLSLGDFSTTLNGITRVVAARKASATGDRQRILDLAESLWVLSECQDFLNSRAEAVEAAAEASQLLFDLATKEPASYEVEYRLAMYLYKLSVSERLAGQIEAAIFVDLNKEVERQEKLTGKTLSENEILQLRYNSVMREAAKIQGAAAAASGSAEAQSKALAREVNELREVIGETFQGYLRSWVGHLRDLVGFLKDNSDWLVKFAQGAMVAAGILATYALATKIMEIGAAVEGLTAVLALNPWALLITGVVASGAIIYKTWSDTQARLERDYEDLRRKALQKDLFSGKLKPDDVKKMGYTDEQIREIVSGRRLIPGESWGDFSGMGLPKIKIVGKGELSDDEVNRIATERKKRGEAEKSAQELYMRAVEERKNAEHDQARARIEDSMRIIETTQSETQAAKEASNVVSLSMQERAAGIEKIREEEKREITERSTYTDEKSGAVRHFKLSASSLETIHKATAEKLAAFDMKFNEEESRRVESIVKAAADRSKKLWDQQMYEREQKAQWEDGNDIDGQRRDIAIAAIEYRKKAELAQLESVDAKTLQAKVALENAKTGVETEAIGERTRMEQQESAWQQSVEDQARTARIQAVDQRKNLELAQLDAIEAVTIQDKVRLEEMKTSIEVQALKDRAKIEMEQIDAQTERQVDAAKKAAMAQGIFYQPYLDQIGDKIRELGQHEKGIAPEGDDVRG